jgi:hypothetical protein
MNRECFSRTYGQQCPAARRIADHERAQEIVRLRSASPLRYRPGRPPTAQAEVDGLALFDQHRSPKLF